MGMIHKISKAFDLYNSFGGVFGILKTIFLNFRILPFKQAVRFPIFISGKAKIKGAHRGCIVFDEKPFPGMLRIGVHSHTFCPYMKMQIFLGGTLVLHRNGIRTFESDCFIGVGPNCVLEIGPNFYLCKGSRIICHHYISIGENNVWQEDTWAFDHETFVVKDNNGEVVSTPEPILIGNDVWIQPRVIIKKGTNIPDDSIIGIGSLCEGDFNRYGENNLLIKTTPKIEALTINYSKTSEISFKHCVKKQLSNKPL